MENLKDVVAGLLIYDNGRLHLVEDLFELKDVRNNLIVIYYKLMNNKELSDKEINYITKIKECQQSDEFSRAIQVQPVRLVHAEEGLVDGEPARIVYETDTKRPLEELIKIREAVRNGKAY